MHLIVQQVKQQLMSHAFANKSHQFFFFTPLDLTQIPSKDEAMVLR